MKIDIIVKVREYVGQNYYKNKDDLILCIRGEIIDFICGSGFSENYMGEFVGGGTTMNTPGVGVRLEYPRHKQPHIKHDRFCDSR